MNVNQCQKMMGRGVDGGCGTEEKLCPISRVSLPSTQGQGQCPSSEGIGFYEQARKSLTEKCPFDSDELVGSNSNVVSSRVSTLPAGLADFLCKFASSNNHTRKRHKKTGNTDTNGATQVRGGKSNIWIETEDVFRQVGVNDIEVLFEKSSFVSLATQSCFTIPPAKENVCSASIVGGSEAVASGLESEHVAVKEEQENGEQPMEIDVVECQDVRMVEVEVKIGNIDEAEANVGKIDGAEVNVGNVDEAKANVGNIDVIGANISNRDSAEASVGKIDVTEVSISNRDIAEANLGKIDVTEASIGSRDNTEANVGNEAEVIIDSSSSREETERSLAMAPFLPAGRSCHEWLLGSKNKILLTSERPSKKRKLLGSDAGLDRLRLVCPSQGHSSPVCHVCCLGGLDEHLNQLLVCDSCKVAVHQRCYGVEEFPTGSWLCSWCKYCNESGSELLSTPCFLCPKSGGALKPMGKDSAERKPSVSVKFAHLFCSQWMPELYVEDTRKMEPIVNIGGIKDTRKKLVCNVCKVKYGACLRCTHGTCRTSFHPICAREARQKMEIWGKTGLDPVELRAFCLKHSDSQDNITQLSNNHPSVAVSYDSSLSIPVKSLVKKPHKLKLSLKNGDKNMILVPALDTVSNKSGNSEVSSERDSSVPISNTKAESDCHDAQSSVSMETPDGVKKNNENGFTYPADSQDFIQSLRKLVDQGKASLEDVALEIGVSYDSLTAILVGNQPIFSPDLHRKLVKWIRNHEHMGTLQSLSNSTISLRTRVTRSDSTNAVGAVDGDNLDAAHVKAPPSNSIRITKDDNIVCPLKDMVVQPKDTAIGMGETYVHSLVPNGDSKEFGNGSIHLDGNPCFKEKDDKTKASSETSGYEDIGSIEQSVRPEVELGNGSLYKSGQGNEDDSMRVGLTSSNIEHPTSSADVSTPIVPNSSSVDSSSCSYVHPVIQERLMRLHNSALVKQENINLDLNAPLPKLEQLLEAEKMRVLDQKDSSSICSNNKVPDPTPCPLKLEQLVEAEKKGVLDLSPNDEVEGQLIYFQNKLIDNVVTSRRHCDDLIFRVVKALPQELNAERSQRWDSVYVNQYLCKVREAKKQGRKERRHKEAQAVLAAATAAAAASSRISSFRKDSHDEVSQETSVLGGRTSAHPQLVPRPKETLSRLAAPRVSSEKPSDIFQLRSFLNENQQLCDICRRSETMLNPIIVCFNCKVAVHFGCYRGVKDHIGPWYCELCEDYRSSRSLSVHSRETYAVSAQCGLCGGTTGAFRKCTDGQWVHAFCAEWLLESTFRRGQPNLVEGVETSVKGRDGCFICSRRIGLCIKCNYGNCQSMFHPSCARNAGFYMHVKTAGGKLLRKAYCDRHSLEQREKAEAQQHGPEELKAVKQIRVELERVRLLCERIIKREKVKRELIICSHNILASKRDSVAFSVLVRSPFFLPDVSSESATTSLRGGHVDDTKSSSEAMQRSDDVTVDSAVSGIHRDRGEPMETDQRTDDSSTSQHPPPPPTTRKFVFSGKQLPRRPTTTSFDDEERLSKLRKHTETFSKELVMTSDQASLQNQRLPKGFAYVPVVSLPKEKPPPTPSEDDSVEPDDG
ncbi:hypothetical protein ACHQM5_016441 [Ranunculus cassubicifolius]